MTETLSSPHNGPPPAESLDRRAEAEIAAPLWASAIAALVLLGIFVLAFSAATKPLLADRITLPFLGVLAAAYAWTPLVRRVVLQRDAATFALCAALFVVYGLARRVAPDEGGLNFSGDTYPISYAAWCAVVGAVLSAPAWLKAFEGWTRAIVSALALLAAIAFFSFNFLKGFYPAGPTEVLDTTTLVHFGMQTVEYGALALCCTGVAAHPRTRTALLTVLPVLLMALWARHQFMAGAATEEDE
jgi:hypothetical protein